MGVLNEGDGAMHRNFLDINLSRAQGCLLDQLAGDSLGSLIEFRPSDDIRREYPNGVRELVDGGTRNTRASQPTDDSKTAPSPTRMPADQGRYDPVEARKVYILRLGSDRIYSQS